jgi:beta-lactamase class D
MKRIIRSASFLVLIFAVHSCTVNNVTVDEKLGRIFENNGVKGTFGMFDNSRGEFTIYDLDRFKSPAVPGQTFQVLSTLIALHTGKLTDERSTVTAGDSVYSTLRIDSAFKKHSDPHLTAVAKLIGRDTLKYWIDSVKYGNKKIGKALTAFWNDSLTISPDEQLGLAKRLYFRQLPFRASVQESVKKMMVVQNNSQLQLAYQIGIIPQVKGQLVWVMGWIEENRHVYPFVVQFDAAPDADGRAIGEKLSRELLEDLGFFKGRM